MLKLKKKKLEKKQQKQQQQQAEQIPTEIEIPTQQIQQIKLDIEDSMKKQYKEKQI